jgi:hypothetical protein
VSHKKLLKIILSMIPLSVFCKASAAPCSQVFEQTATPMGCGSSRMSRGLMYEEEIGGGEKS